MEKDWSSTFPANNGNMYIRLSAPEENQNTAMPNVLIVIRASDFLMVFQKVDSSKTMSARFLKPKLHTVISDIDLPETDHLLRNSMQAIQADIRENKGKREKRQKETKTKKKKKKKKKKKTHSPLLSPRAPLHKKSPPKKSMRSIHKICLL